jgi:hypothetical protein
MDSKILLNKIFTLLSIDAKEVELTRDVVYGSLLPDNDILEVSEWKIGVPVFVISEDGTKKPLIDGEYDIVIEDTADGLSQGGPTKYALKIDGNKIESLQIKQLKETKAITNKTQSEKTETMELKSMEEKAMVPETKSPEKEEMQEPLKDLGPEEKYATKAEIEDIKKAIEELTKAFASLTKEKGDETEMGSEEKMVTVPETKVPGKEVKMSSARKLTGAPEAAKPSYNEFYNNKSEFETTQQRVFRKMSQF